MLKGRGEREGGRVERERGGGRGEGGREGRGREGRGERGRERREREREEREERERERERVAGSEGRGREWWAVREEGWSGEQ